MRRKLLLALAASAAVAVGMAAIASAKFDVYRVGDIIVKVDGGVTPKALPKKTDAPVTVRIRGQIASADGSHPPAFRELIAEFDKNGKINTKGLATCKGGQLEARTTASAKSVCGKSVVGSGSGRIQISFPEQAPIPVNAPITVFNGGTSGGKTTLYIHTYITVPVPAAVVTTVTIKKISKGRYGLGTVSKVPVIAGGSGSVLEFDIKFGKKFNYKGRKQSYFLARCTDGRFQAHITKAIFRNEAGGPRTQTIVSDETVIRPCTPKG
ncbi:MAG TPA: hypothetical protein VNP96_04485 [Solirubrobacterales bacterium]|nr:hypothetical protein [Solirubrobacterales bacterium]